jgi:transcriptional regulator with XRE-family HTH domain
VIAAAALPQDRECATKDSKFNKMLEGAMSLGEKLKMLREERGILQKQLAGVIGVHSTDISRWERGRNSPSVETLGKLAQFFGVTTDYLVFESAPRNGRVDVRDVGLLEQFERADSLGQEERGALKVVTESLLLRHQVHQTLQSTAASEVA